MHFLPLFPELIYKPQIFSLTWFLKQCPPVPSCVDGPPPVPGAPGAPMDIKIHDANRDYVIVSWKPPNTTTEGPILGYFVDK